MTDNISSSMQYGTEHNYKSMCNCHTKKPAQCFPDVLDQQQGSHATLNKPFPDLFKTLSRLFSDLTFWYGLPRSNTGTIIFNTM